MKRPLRNLLLSKPEFHAAWITSFAMLRGEFALLIVSIALFYIILDSYNNVKVFIPWYLLLIALAIGAIYLNRNQHYLSASLAILITINSLVFLFADVDHPYGGVYFFFLSSSLTGLILFNQYHWIIGVFFASLPIMLGYAAFASDFDLIPRPICVGNMVQINFLANFTIGCLSSIFIVQFLRRLNRESEHSLMASEEHIRKTSEDLKRSEERFALALKGTRAGIYEWDVAINKVYVSDYWKSLLGFSSGEMDEVTLQTFLSLLHPEDAARMSKTFEIQMKEMKPLSE